MENPSFGMFIAVFEEMFGRGLFWSMVVAAVIITVLYLYVLIRDRAVSWQKFLLAQLSMPVGALAAVVLLWQVTHSSLSDVGGPIDVIVLLGVAAVGAVGMAIAVYTVQSLIRGSAQDDR